MKTFKELQDFYQGKKVLLTGHTGFKGSYLTVLLGLTGARVYGYSLPAPTDPSLFEILYGPGSSRQTRKDLKLADGGISGIGICESHIGDIRDFGELNTYVNHVRPDIIIHMAAQPIVRESYRIPRETFETNVMGTVNLLEAVRQYAAGQQIPGQQTPGQQTPEQQTPEQRADTCACAAEETGDRISFLNVTTDKVYRNKEKPGYAYREDDRLDGYDPYSNSKSCSELVTHSYRSSFFGTSAGNVRNSEAVVRVSTARAGNVIGGGDFAKDRLIPDCMRARLAGGSVTVRNPFSTRPFQHVLEPLFVYLEIAMEQYADETKQGYYNVGPDLCDCVTAGELCDLYASCAEGFRWENRAEKNAPHEADFLRLDNTKIRETFGWKPVWHIRDAVKASADWCEAYRESPEASVRELLRQIDTYVNRKETDV